MPAASALKPLVVDDQMSIRALVKQSLKSIGVTDVVEAGDGEDALRQMLQRPRNLIISDFNMPKLDGLQLLRAVRAHPPISKTAFVMLTGRADDDLVKRASQFGVNNYLVKPFTVDTLRTKLEEIFGALT